MTRVTVVEEPSFHSIFTQSDLNASTCASIDLACMLVAYINPAIVVEAGTYYGHLSFAMANVIRRLGRKGIVYTADPIDNVTGVLQGQCAILQPYLRYYRTDFKAMLDGIEGLVDFAYIDASDLNNPHLRWDHAQAVYDRMRPGGLILIDDTESPDWVDAPRFRLWAKDHGIHLCGHRGLTIIQKDRFECSTSLTET